MRLRARVTTLQRKLEAEGEALLRRQQAHARARNLTPAEDAEASAAATEAGFRIAVLEQRIVAMEASIPARIAEMAERLKADPRLAVLYAPEEWKRRQDALGDD